MELFSVTCATCRRKLRVRDPAAIGRILACPKCGSMVEVTPPDGWEPPDEQDAVPLASDDVDVSDDAATDDTATDDTVPEDTAPEDIDKSEAADTDEDREPADESPRAPRHVVLWGVGAVVVVIVGVAWTLLPATTPQLSVDDVPLIDGAPLTVDGVATPDIDEPVVEVSDPVPLLDVPTDPWQRFLYDQMAVSSLLADEPFQLLFNVWSHRVVAQMNRAEIERVVYAARTQRLTGALLQYVAAGEETFPAGAAGSTLLDVDTRLSWIASILPELGQPAWHEQLRFSRAWNAADNRDVTTQALAAVLNPGVTERLTADGIGLTHFVGLAGLRDDAARLDAADPRAGVFSYNEPRTVAQISDGLSQTIAIMSVAERLGPWAQGGVATVRPLTSEPYINGPDGFGSGDDSSGSRADKNSDRGMLVGMADGSVRFLAAETDPRLLEQLATIAAGPAPSAVAVGVPLAEWLPHDEPAGDGPPGSVADADQPPADAESAAWLIALEQRLALPIRDVRLTEVTLDDFCSFVARMAGVPVRLTADVSGGERIGPSDTLSFRLDDATVGEMLSATLATRGLRPVIGPEGIDVFSAEQPSPVVALAYDIATLAAGQHVLTEDRHATAEQIAELVRRFAVRHSAAPDETARVGIRADGQLVVEAHMSEHREVVRLIGALSVLAGVEPPVAMSPPHAVFGPDWAAIERRLTAPVSLPAVGRVGWAELADVWHDKLGLNVLLDAEAVAGSEIPLAWPGSDVVENQPLGDVLDQWLAPLGLAHSWPGEDTIRITTAAKAAVRDVLAWHRLPENDPSGEAYDDEGNAGDGAALVLTDAVRASVAPGSWLESGGVGDMLLDPANGYLLVRQTEAVQRQVQRFLAERSAASTTEAENRQ